MNSRQLEDWLNGAPDEVVLAVHDLTHRLISERHNSGVRPSEKRLRAARRTLDSAAARSESGAAVRPGGDG